MPLPKPGQGEERDKFIPRCMSSEVMKREFPKNVQRLAVCFSQYRKGQGDKK